MVVDNCQSNAPSRRKKSKHLPPSTKPSKAGLSFRRTRIAPTRFNGRHGSSPSSADGPATPRIGHPDQSPSTTEWLASKSSSLAEPSKMCRNTSVRSGTTADAYGAVLLLLELQLRKARQGAATVEDDRSSGHEIEFRAADPDYHISDFLFRNETAERSTGNCGALIVDQRVGTRAGNLARNYGVHGHGRRELERKGLGEVNEGRLGEAINRMGPHEARCGAQIDDAATAPADHGGTERLRQLERGTEIGGDHRVPRRVLQIEQRRSDERASRVDEDVDLTEPGADICRELTRACAVGEIGLERDGVVSLS